MKLTLKDIQGLPDPEPALNSSVTLPLPSWDSGFPQDSHQKAISESLSRFLADIKESTQFIMRPMAPIPYITFDIMICPDGKITFKEAVNKNENIEVRGTGMV